MKKTKPENVLAGLTSEAQDGRKSSESMRHGDESRGMLLALLNSPLETMIANKQARILGKGLFVGGSVGTIVIFYGTEPTDDGKMLAMPTVTKGKSNE